MTRNPNRVRIHGPLAVHAVGFAEELTRRGYPPERAVRHVQLLAHLSRWLEAEGLTSGELTEERVTIPDLWTTVSRISGPGFPDPSYSFPS